MEGIGRLVALYVAIEVDWGCISCGCSGINGLLLWRCMSIHEFYG